MQIKYNKTWETISIRRKIKTNMIYECMYVRLQVHTYLFIYRIPLSYKADFQRK